MLIRKMKSEDVFQAAEIEKKSFSMPWSPEGFKGALAYEDNIILVAEEEGRIAGYACVYVSFDEGELTNIAVEPEYRGRGIGLMLMKELKHRAEDKSVSKIVLEVRISNATAISLYEKCGFKNLGTRKNFYEQPVEDAYIMAWQAEEI